MQAIFDSIPVLLEYIKTDLYTIIIAVLSVLVIIMGLYYVVLAFTRVTAAAARKKDESEGEEHAL